MAQTHQEYQTDCMICAARQDGLCTELSQASLLRIKKFRSGDRKIIAGADIFSPGEHCNTIFNLVDGWAFRYGLLKDGRRQILDFIIPGAVIGFHPAKGAKTTYGVQTLTDSIVCTIRQDDFATLSQEVPQVGMRLAWLMTRDQSLAFDHLTSLGRRSARQHIAHLLVELFVRFKTQWPRHPVEKIYLPLTQEHIGDATGLTNIHVNRVLRDLRIDGVLQLHYGKLHIINPEKLMNIAEMDPDLMKSWTRRLKALNGDEQAPLQEPVDATVTSIVTDAIDSLQTCRALVA